MALQPGIILSGQVPDTVNTLARSTQAARMANTNQRENALAQVYQQYGPDIMAGKPEAMNALAQQDPMQALGIQQAQRGGEIADQEFQMKVAEYARGLSREQAAAEAQAIEQGIVRGISAYQMGDLDGVNAILQQAGEQPIQSLEEFPAVAARYGEALDVLKSVSEFSAGPEPDYVTLNGQLVDRNAPGGPVVVDIEGAGPPAPLSAAGKLKADLDAGRITPEQFNAAMQKDGIRVQSDGRGGFTFEQGPGVTGGEAEGPENPTSPMAMINSIDGILNDPALDTATGVLSFMQAVPGTPQRRVGARIKQLNGQAFLQAFKFLKGSGQITEIEGQKATEAIGRLDSAQRTEDYRAALIELRSLLAVASERPEGWVSTQKGINAARDIIPADDIKAMSPDEITALGAGAITRIPVSELKGLSDAQWDALEALAEGE